MGDPTRCDCDAQVAVHSTAYNLTNEQLERELADRISFRVFLGTTEVVPDSTTIWKFREHLAEIGIDKEVWIEMQRQLDSMNLKVQKGIMQDDTFITSDPVHAKAGTPHGDEAKTRRSNEERTKVIFRLKAA